MNLREIDRLIGKEFFGVQELTVEEAVEKFAEKSFRTFTHDGCFVDRYTKLKFDKQEYDRRFKGGYYIPAWKTWLIENSTVVTTYPPYSSDMNEAWKVVEKLYEDKKLRMFVGMNFPPLYEARLMDEKGDWIGHGVDAETAPLAICLVALKWRGIEVKTA
jgi:hypothetical protein